MTTPRKGDGCSAEGKVHGGEPEVNSGSRSNVRCWIAQKSFPTIRRAWNVRKAILFAYVKFEIPEGSAISSNHQESVWGSERPEPQRINMSAGDPKFLLNSPSVG